MFAGHVGAALALGSGARRVNAGVLIFAALGLDLILWTLVLAGVEHAIVPADFARRRYFVFDFPYSHGLAASLGWSLLAACITGVATRSWQTGRGRAAAIVAAAVFSHWMLDALVHGTELPLLGPGSRLVGLGLWDHLPVELAVEAAIAAIGLVLFLSGSGLSRLRTRGLALIVLTVIAMTVVGMTVAPAPSDMRQPAIVSFVMISVLSALGGWLGADDRPSDTAARNVRDR